MGPPPPFEILTPYLRTDRDSPAYHYFPIPTDVAEELIGSGTRRVVAEVRKHVFRRSLFRMRDGTHAIIVGRSTVRQIRPGSIVGMRIWSDPEPDRVDLCAEWLGVLEQDPEAASLFHSLTPGRRRSISLYLNEGKRIETRLKRAFDIAERIKADPAYFGVRLPPSDDT